jgi:nitroreductase
MAEDLNIKEFRQPEREINPLLLRRWSPRALSGEPVSEEELMALFEAAKWAPSAYNAQPWRFIYVKNNTPDWEKLFSVLAAPNQIWVKKAAVLILILAQKNFAYNDQPNRTALFDAGAAWENLALEAVSRGLIAHAMSGFDYEAARFNLNIPAAYEIAAMIAVGRPGDKEDLPEKLRAAEFPSDRKKRREISSEGEFIF